MKNPIKWFLYEMNISKLEYAWVGFKAISVYWVLLNGAAALIKGGLERESLGNENALLIFLKWQRYQPQHS